MQDIEQVISGAAWVSSLLQQQNCVLKWLLMAMTVDICLCFNWDSFRNTFRILFVCLCLNSNSNSEILFAGLGLSLPLISALFIQGLRPFYYNSLDMILSRSPVYSSIGVLTVTNRLSSTWCLSFKNKQITPVLVLKECFYVVLTPPQAMFIRQFPRTASRDQSCPLYCSSATCQKEKPSRPWIQMSEKDRWQSSLIFISMSLIGGFMGQALWNFRQQGRASILQSRDI